PVGFGLALDSMPWASPGDYPYVHSPDPSQQFAPLARHAEIRRQLHGFEERTPDGDRDGAARLRARGEAEGLRGDVAEDLRDAQGLRDAAARGRRDPSLRAPLHQESAGWVS